MSDAATLIAIPVVAALIGYGTNWLTVRMIYYPAHFVGIGPLGWQGIVHRMSDKFAREFAGTIRSIVSPQEIVGRIDVGSVLAAARTEFPEAIDSALVDVIDAAVPGHMVGLDDAERAAVVRSVDEAAGRIADRLASIAAEHADGLLDIETLAVELLSGSESARLARISKSLGRHELRAIEVYGAVFGLVIGLVQVLTFVSLSIWWLLPIVGAVVGAGTNWMALKMIFRPLERTRYLGVVTYQGLFPRRQSEIAREFASATSKEILTAELVLQRAARSPQAGAVIQSALLVAGDGVTEILAAALERQPTESEVTAATLALLEVPNGLDPDLRQGISRAMDDALALDELMGTRLGEMPKLEFERLLRGIFEEDEMKLVVIGGVLGAAVGVLQAVVLF